MLIYELLFIILIIWIFTIVISKDLFSPCSVLCLSYILASLCAIYNINNWRLDLHLNTFLIILIGLLSFAITSFVFYFFVKKKKVSQIDKAIDFIQISSLKRNLINILSLLIFIIYFIYFIKAIGGISALSNFSEAMQIYRSKTLYHNIVLIPTWINFLSKICKAVCYINTYIIINNIIVSKLKSTKYKLKNNFSYFLSIIIYLPLTLMSGGRYDLIVYFIYVITCFSILYTIGTKKRLDISKILKICLVLIVVLTAFSSYKGLVGRQNDDSSTVDYITEYFGGSIAIFDMYMQENHSKAPYFGQETFYGIRKLLYQFKLIDNQGESSDIKEFRTIYNGKVIGNVYTGFRKMYHDFGLVGVVILQIVLAIIFNATYYKCFYKKEKYQISFKIILYSSICFCLALHSYAEAFYCNVLSFNYFVLFIIINLLIIFYSKVELKWN